MKKIIFDLLGIIFDIVSGIFLAYMTFYSLDYEFYFWAGFWLFFSFFGVISTVINIACLVYDIKNKN